MDGSLVCVWVWVCVWMRVLGRDVATEQFLLQIVQLDGLYLRTIERGLVWWKRGWVVVWHMSVRSVDASRASQFCLPSIICQGSQRCSLMKLK